jgi:hypothetical protein
MCFFVHCESETVDSHTGSIARWPAGENIKRGKHEYFNPNASD